MTRLDRKRFLQTASATGVVAALNPAAALARSGDARKPSLVGVTADDGSRVIAQTVLDPRTVDVTIDSAALGHTASARIILPNRFASHSSSTWPVLYLLHGGFGTSVDWTESSRIADLARERDVLVVMPDGGSLGFYTDWWDRGAGNKPGWETFHMVELAQILERGLGAGDRRAIAGLSMGGFGVMSYAGRHPGFFRGAASFSGVLDTLHPTVAPIFPGLYATWLLQTFVTPLGYDALALFGDPVAQRAVWAAHNPVDLVANLSGTTLFVSCGNGSLGSLDPPGTDPSNLLAQLEAALLLQSREFVSRAGALGLDVTVDFYGAGTHTWPYWARQLERAFPLLMQSIGAA
jgi:diacylglycerol O-acyltransferase / trehalose O-mycolyltransferase / mycolyltransferase Ag85